ncbi:MAG: bifunctional 5,10-methylenetetrahydrofolate dehydrogenase/5,10-methenyltetrahydrofolate cyclohydrolase [Patescibacteria group bacterium]
MKLLEGKKISERILKKLENRIKKEKLKPALAVILVGDDKASEIYVKLKKKSAERIGIRFRLFRFEKNENENTIMKKLSDLNKNKNVSGIIVQLPLPKKFSTQKIINSIDPKKDVDGFSAKNGSAFGGHPLKSFTGFQPVFPHAIIKLLKAVPRAELSERYKAVALVNSKKFGEVMVAALAKKKIKAGYIFYKELKKNPKVLKQADIIISACGRPGFIKGKMVKAGVIIIDGGITKRGERVLGDADRQSLEEIVGYLSPVPGGVGPVTIACLLENVYIASKKQSK